MPATTKIPEEQLAEYFAAFTRRFLRDDSPESADIEVMEPHWGDQSIARNAHLVGITYEENTRTLELELDSSDHRIVKPAEIWVLEEPDGFIDAIEVVHTDGSREVVSIKRAESHQDR